MCFVHRYKKTHRGGGHHRAGASGDAFQNKGCVNLMLNHSLKLTQGVTNGEGEWKMHVFEKKNYMCTGPVKFAHGGLKMLRMAILLQWRYLPVNVSDISGWWHTSYEGHMSNGKKFKLILGTWKAMKMS